MILIVVAVLTWFLGTAYYLSSYTFLAVRKGSSYDREWEQLQVDEKIVTVCVAVGWSLAWPARLLFKP